MKKMTLRYTYDIVYTPDAKVPVHTVEGLEISLKELFEE